MLKNARTWIHAAVGILFAAGFLTYAMWDIPFSALGDELGKMRLWTLGPILGTIAVFFWLKAVRWSYLLRPLRPEAALSTRQVFPAMMIGFMGNNVLPAHLGEFVRMFVLGKQYGLSKTAVLSTIVLERVLDFMAIIVIFALALQVIPAAEDDKIETVRTFGYVIAAGSGGGFLVFLFFVWKTELALRWTELALGFVPAKLRARALELVRLAIPGLCSLRSPRLLLGLLLLTLVHWAMNGLGLYLAAVSCMGEGTLPVTAAAFLLGVCALGVTLPSAPGYVGTLQACYVVALGVFAVAEAKAVVASFYYLIVSYVPVTLIGLFFLYRLGFRLRTLSREAEAEEAGEATDA